MSLDVSLIMNNAPSEEGSGIFVREDGQIKEISRIEWNEKFPDREPVNATWDDDNEVYTDNITHNLNTMAGIAGIYEYLWRPDEVNVTKAAQLIQPLTKGLDDLQAYPKKFKEYNPENGWGDYEGLVTFVHDYLAACEAYPNADIYISR